MTLLLQAWLWASHSKQPSESAVGFPGKPWSAWKRSPPGVWVGRVAHSRSFPGLSGRSRLVRQSCFSLFHLPWLWVTLGCNISCHVCQDSPSVDSDMAGARVFFFFFFKLIATLFIFGCVGSSFRARAFSSCGKRGPFFIAARGPLTLAAPPVAGHRLQRRRLSNCGSRA